MVPPASTTAWACAGDSFTCTGLPSASVMLIVDAASSAATPPWPTWIDPVLRTSLPASTTYCCAAIEPSFSTCPPPAAENVAPFWPAMKSAFDTACVPANSAPTLTCAPRPNSTPSALSTYTWPLPVSWPSMVLDPAPTTRLRIAAEASGCTKCTALPAPMSKLFQLTTARSLPCVTVIALPLTAPITACPATTWPPVGSTPAACASGSQPKPEKPIAMLSASCLSGPRPDSTRRVALRSPGWPPGPSLSAVSATAINAPRCLLKMIR
ncbi:hypothetical protein GALL_376350 [mine drainage metagenome]|uniref:Uncharacterized protein n=1 Tax=mine drainage metagenome TaxID=410659 RepID=A0A1J5QAD5_9ZZZZ